MKKKQQRWVASFVALAVLWLMQVSVMPLPAAGAEEQLQAAGSGDVSGAYEVAGQQASSGGKKSILPFVLIGVGVVAAAAVLYFFVLKTNYDITGGGWSMTYSYGYGTITYPITLTGDKKSGTAVLYTTNGTYSVSGKKVTINTYQGNAKWEFIGEFTTKDRVEGDFKYYENNVLQPQYNGTFFMVR
jgi:hypothetical protein